MGSLADSVERSLAECHARVLVACSGGADSVALAAEMARQAPIAVGHVDHALRADSAGDAEHVRKLAERLGMPFFVERLSGLSEKNLEAAAREARYAALGRLARQAGARFVATAHTQRDQAETLLLRLIRGAGPEALAGIRKRRPLTDGVELIRPLLDVSREATESYCRERGLAFVTDPHNTDEKRARARLRQLWPALLELNPRLEETLAGTARLFAEDPLSLRLKQNLLREANQKGLRPERKHLEKLLELLAKGGGAVDVPGGRAQVVFEQATVAVPSAGRYAWRSRELLVTEGRGEGLAVDLSSAPFPWTLRGQGRSSLALLEDAAGRPFWVEGSAYAPPASGGVTFRILPEMKAVGGRLTSSRRRSATMGRGPDEEPR